MGVRIPCVIPLCGNRKYRSLVIIITLCTLTILVGFNFIKMSSSNTVLIYPLSDSVVFTKNMLVPNIRQRYSTVGDKHYELKLKQNAVTERLVKTFGKAIVDNVIKYVDNSSKLDFPVTVHKSYLMENPSLCSSVVNLDVLVVVHTAPNHFDRRGHIRRTWTNETYFKHLGSVRVLFLLGKVKDVKIQQKLEQEFKTHQDLLQGDFIDAYRNLTLKGVMAYKWISERCRNAKIILKVDDDIVVDTFRLFTEYVPIYKNKTKQILCNHILPGTMLIIRNKKSKWHVDDKLFSGQKFYPRYCSGFLVLITNDVIPAIYRSASVTPFFWVDDVYLYGLAPGRIPGIKYNGLKKGSHQLNGKLATTCYRNKTKTCNFLVTGASNRAVFDEIWDNMNTLYKARTKLALTTDIPIQTTSEDVGEVDDNDNDAPNEI